MIKESNDGIHKYVKEDWKRITNFNIGTVEVLIGANNILTKIQLIAGDKQIDVIFDSDAFSRSTKFEEVLNKADLSLSFYGSLSDLRDLKEYIIANKTIEIKEVVDSGIHESDDGSMLFVDDTGSYNASFQDTKEYLQRPENNLIKSSILKAEEISKEEFEELIPLIWRSNEELKAVTLLTWACACFFKEHLRSKNVKFPFLGLIGEAGSGKSTTLERILVPMFGIDYILAAAQVTEFTLLRECSSSNLIPYPVDEYKPSTLAINKVDLIHNHLRNSYDGHAGVRGKADQSVVSYQALSPMIIAGEEEPREPAIRERGMILVYSKKDIKDDARRNSMSVISSKKNAIRKLGKSMLKMALTFSADDIFETYTKTFSLVNNELPPRAVNNIACCALGFVYLDRLSNQLGLQLSSLVGKDLSDVVNILQETIKQYTFDGTYHNLGIVEETLEIMLRWLETKYNVTCKGMFVQGDNLYLRVQDVYDEFTYYVKRNNIMFNPLDQKDFKRKLYLSDLCIQKSVLKSHFGESQRYTLIDYKELNKRLCGEEYSEPDTELDNDLPFTY